MADPQDNARAEESGAPTRLGLSSLVGSAFIFIMLGGLVVAFSILEGTAFLSGDNFLNIAVDASELLLLAVGVTFVIITAGIDLSVGSVLVLSSVIAAQTMVALSRTTPTLTRPWASRWGSRPASWSGSCAGSSTGCSSRSSG
jgi:ribose transport system permease protein